MPTLGLSMIVKNGAKTLRRCLESAAGLVDAMVIGDTGSTDETIAIAREFGATVLPLVWNDDFAAARNAVLAALHTDWVLTLDADEELPAVAPAWIRTAITAPGVAAYLTQVRNYLSPHLPPPVDQITLAPGDRHPQAPDAVAYFASACCRLFRKQPGIVYTGCVHEMVDYQLPGLGNGVEVAGFVIHHFGWYLADAGRTAQKRTLYRELLARKLEQMPDDANTLVRYGLLLAEDTGQPEAGLTYTRRAAELDGSAAGAWLFTGMLLRRLGRYAESLDALAKAPPGDQPAFQAQLRGDALYGMGLLGEAREAYEAAHRLAPRERRVSSKLGLLEVRLGHEATGLARLREAADTMPPVAEADEMLVCGYLAAGRNEEAAAAAECLARKHANADAWLKAAHLYGQLSLWEEALRILDRAIAQFPRAEKLHALCIHGNVALGRLPEAARAAQRVAELNPTPNSFLRLAAILAQCGKEAAAHRILLQAAELFPGSNELTGATAEVAPDRSERTVAHC